MADVMCLAFRKLGWETVPSPLRRHVSACLVCQAELSRNRRLVRRLGTLRDAVVAPPYDLTSRLSDVAVAVAPPEQQKVAGAGRLIAASAVGATAGVLAVAALRRRGAA